jgi:HlyD family secretion protein
MSRVALGRLLLACLLATCAAAGRAADDTPEKKAADSAPAAKKTTKKAKKKPTEKKSTEAKPAETKPAEKKPDEKKPAEKKPAEKKPAGKKPEETKADAKSGEKKGDAKEASAKPATEKLKKGPFRIEVSLDGVFEAQNQAELFVRPTEWPALSVLKAVEHGTVVKQGDLVLAFDTDKIDRAIAEFRSELELNELALKQSAAQLAAIERIAPLEDQANNRNRRITEEDWKRFQDVEKPLMVKVNDYRLKSAQENMEYAQEEYNQLEKMYKADDLSEETEKIVLRRAKAGVDRAKLFLELAEASHDEDRKLSLPRTEERVKDQTERSLIDVEFTKITLPLLMSRHRLEQEKLQITCDQARDKLKKLVADRDAMTVKAPIDGIVYYGHATRGKWSPVNPEMFRRGAPVQPNDIFMTIVQPRPLVIRATVPESHFQHVRPGLQAVVQPEGFSGPKLSAIVERVSAIPLGSSGFDCQLTVASEGLVSAIVPGISCDLKMIAYKKSDALTVPPKAIFTEELDLAKQYVYLLGKDGKTSKRVVTLGERNEKQVEVLQGLAAGDEILLEKPKDE